jgi:hypothetical protein
MEIFPSIWGSIVKHTQGLITELNTQWPLASIQFVDWEAHANIEELPDVDLIGPTALTFMEVSPQMYDVNFSIAVSTYKTDENLFRLRSCISKIYESLRPTKQVEIFENGTINSIGYLVCQDGTAILPMSRALTRPWQYVQVNGLLEPALGET